MAADVNFALFQELFGYVFSLVGDETKVFAFILDLKTRKKVVLIKVLLAISSLCYYQSLSPVEFELTHPSDQELKRYHVLFQARK